MFEKKQMESVPSPLASSDFDVQEKCFPPHSGSDLSGCLRKRNLPLYRGLACAVERKVRQEQDDMFFDLFNMHLCAGDFGNAKKLQTI